MQEMTIKKLKMQLNFSCMVLSHRILTIEMRPPLFYSRFNFVNALSKKKAKS